jgi:hypothetical protein
MMRLAIACCALLALAASSRDGCGDGTEACRVSGCSSHVCADHDVVTTCEWLPEYECYGAAQCERQADGQCGWTQTPELLACIDAARGQ